VKKGTLGDIEQIYARGRASKISNVFVRKLKKRPIRTRLGQNSAARQGYNQKEQIYCLFMSWTSFPFRKTLLVNPIGIEIEG
jgi:hypothetical protein